MTQLDEARRLWEEVADCGSGSILVNANNVLRLANTSHLSTLSRELVSEINELPRWRPRRWELWNRYVFLRRIHQIAKEAASW